MYKSLVKIAEYFCKRLVEISFFGFVYSSHILNAFAEMQMLVERGYEKKWKRNVKKIA